MCRIQAATAVRLSLLHCVALNGESWAASSALPTVLPSCGYYAECLCLLCGRCCDAGSGGVIAAATVVLRVGISSLRGTGLSYRAYAATCMEASYSA